MNARSSFPRHGAASLRPASGMADAPGAAQPRAALPVHDARHLTGPTGLAQIVLDGQVYSLRITRAGKLILTK